jgi:hypothetical protein
MMIRSLPGIAFGKVEGKINRRVTRKRASVKLDAVHSEPLRLGRCVDDPAPPVESVVKSEGSGIFDQEGAAGGQPIEWLRSSPMPSRCHGLLRLIAAFNAREQLRRGLLCRAASRFRNSACAQTRGMALPVGMPGLSPRSGNGGPSHTCSGMRPHGPVIRVITSR